MGANNITAILQAKCVSIVIILETLKKNAAYLSNLYYKSDVNTVLDGLADNDCIGINAKITKSQGENILTLATQLKKFFGNETVTTGDYLATCYAASYGNCTLVSVRSVATEKYADLCKEFAESCIDAYEKAGDAIDFYNANQIAAIMPYIDDDRIVFGADCTKDDLLDIMDMLTQLLKMFNNEAVTSGDYNYALQVWERFL